MGIFLESLMLGESFEMCPDLCRQVTSGLLTAVQLLGSAHPIKQVTHDVVRLA